MASDQANIPSIHRHFSAVDLTVALVGPSVTLRGISKPRRLPSWMPSADMLATPDGQDPISVNLVSKYSQAAWSGLLILLAALAMVSLGIFLGKNSTPSLAWEVKAITNEGVLVSVAGHTEVLKPGMQLPGGERLISFDPKKQRYATNRMEVTILPSIQNDRK